MGDAPAAQFVTTARVAKAIAKTGAVPVATGTPGYILYRISGTDFVGTAEELCEFALASLGSVRSGQMDKPGWKTSEFLATLAGLGGAATTLVMGLQTDAAALTPPWDHIIPGVCGGALLFLPTAFVWVRTAAKKQAALEAIAQGKLPDPPTPPGGIVPLPKDTK